MRNIFLLFLCGSFCVLTYGQATEDSLYLRNYSDELQALSTVRYNQSRISIAGHQEGTLGFEQSGMTIGTRIQFDNWGLGLNVPTRLFSAGRKGSSLGFHLQLFPRSLLINAGANRLKGFQEVEAGERILLEQPIHQNIQMWHFYLHPVYAFSGERFSLRAFQQLTQRQLKSCGTFLAAFRLEYLRLNNTVHLPEAIIDPHVITDYSLRQSGLEGGYAHTFVLWKAAFISAMATGGLAHTRTSYDLDASRYKFKQWQLVPVGDFNLSLGYNSDRYVGAVQFNYRHRAIKSEDIQMRVNDWSLQFTFGVRFYAPHVRRKLDQQSTRFARNFIPVRA